MTTAHVHLRPITDDNIEECLALRVADFQTSFVASNEKSMEDANSNKTDIPFAIYDAAACGHVKPTVPMIGFTMYELVAGVGFILRLMIDEKYQGKGYGKAAMNEVVRRLRLHPEVELIATSYKLDNDAAANLYKSLGFFPWDIEFAKNHPTGEVFVHLP